MIPISGKQEKLHLVAIKITKFYVLKYLFIINFTRKKMCRGNRSCHGSYASIDAAASRMKKNSPFGYKWHIIFRLTYLWERFGCYQVVNIIQTASWPAANFLVSFRAGSLCCVWLCFTFGFVRLHQTNDHCHHE